MFLKKISIIFALIFLFGCAAPKKMSLNLINQSNEEAIDISERVVLENDYIITNKSEDIIETEYKMDNSFYGLYRWKIIINIVDNNSIFLKAYTELKLSSGTWRHSETLREDIANKILNPLEESFKKYGIVVK